MGLSRGDEDDDDDVDNNVEEKEFYIRDDHFEGILVEDNSKKKMKVSLACHFTCEISCFLK